MILFICICMYPTAFIYYVWMCMCLGLTTQYWGTQSWKNVICSSFSIIDCLYEAVAFHLCVNLCAVISHSCWHVGKCGLWRSCAGSHIVESSCGSITVIARCYCLEIVFMLFRHLQSSAPSFTIFFESYIWWLHQMFHLDLGIRYSLIHLFWPVMHCYLSHNFSLLHEEMSLMRDAKCH